jgi:hypothetical protein
MQRNVGKKNGLIGHGEIKCNCCRGYVGSVKRARRIVARRFRHAEKISLKSLDN